jgi:hypothetical protein
MPYLVRDRESQHVRGVRPCLPSQPLDPINEHRRQRALARLGVDQGVSKLKRPVRSRFRRESHEPHGHLERCQRRVTTRGPPGRAEHPGRIDAGGSQNPGRRTQSDRLVRRRHHRHVVHTHGQLARNLRVTIRRGVYDN